MDVKEELTEIHDIKSKIQGDESHGFFKKKIHFLKESIKSLLTQGLTPRKIAMAFAVGFIIGTFPVLGTHTIMGVGMAFLFNMNHLSVYLGLIVSFPFFLLLLLPSLRVGEFILNAMPMDWDRFSSGLKLMANSWDDFLSVFAAYGISIMHTIVGWAIISIVIGLIIYYMVYFASSKIISQIDKP